MREREIEMSSSCFGMERVWRERERNRSQIKTAFLSRAPSVFSEHVESIWVYERGESFLYTVPGSHEETHACEGM